MKQQLRIRIYYTVITGAFFVFMIRMATAEMVEGFSGKTDKKSWIDPDDFGAVHSNLTFVEAGINQEELNRNFFGIGATLNDPVDWGAWQMAIQEAALSGRMILAAGDYYIRDKQILFPKYFRSVTIQGASCYLHVSGGGGSPLFFRPAPSDNSDANQMINSFVRLEGIQAGNRDSFVNRIAFDLGPTYNSIYRGIDCFNMAEAVHLRFALNTEIDMCTATNCLRGWTADMGNWKGASNSNSQSNHTTFNHCRFYAAEQSDYAFGVYASSGCTVSNCIIEGEQVRVGCDFNAKGSPVVKDFLVTNVHFEAVNGAKEAFIRLRMQGGIAVIDRVFGQYPAYLVDAEAANGTHCFVEVAHVAYWVPVKGKYFKNTGVSWALRYNDNMLFSASEAPTKFAGKMPVYCEGPVRQCGGSSVTVEMIPR